MVNAKGAGQQSQQEEDRMTTELEQIADRAMKKIERHLFMTIPQREQARKVLVQEFAPIVVSQANFHFTEADARTNEDQAMRILALLKERRSTGATNVELSEIALKYTGRISELRQQPHNYRIECTKETGRVTRYRLYPTDW
jgi:hypothetical protein